MAIRIYESSLFKRTEQVVLVRQKTFVGQVNLPARAGESRSKVADSRRKKVQTKNLMCMEKTT